MMATHVEFEDFKRTCYEAGAWYVCNCQYGFGWARWHASNLRPLVRYRAGSVELELRNSKKPTPLDLKAMAAYETLTTEGVR